MKRLSLLVVCLVGCAKGTMADLVDGKPSQTDDALPGPKDGGVDADETEVDAAIDAPPHSDPVPLLLTEVVLAPSNGEFVEILNPSPTDTISLANYYLADSGNYWKVPQGATVDGSDFIVRFPAATIGPRETIVVALDTPANFAMAYPTAAAPTFSVAGGTMSQVVVSGTPSLTNAGELVVLFEWDGASDLVHDVDLLIAGIPTPANGLVDKSGMAVDGPDVGVVTSAYATDAKTIAAQAATPASAKSTKRIALETGHETQGGTGNGITGDDETSENTAQTWDATFSAPTPGAVPAALVP